MKTKKANLKSQSPKQKAAQSPKEPKKEGLTYRQEHPPGRKQTPPLVPLASAEVGPSTFANIIQVFLQLTSGMFKCYKVKVTSSEKQRTL